MQESRRRRTSGRRTESGRRTSSETAGRRESYGSARTSDRGETAERRRSRENSRSSSRRRRRRRRRSPLVPLLIAILVVIAVVVIIIVAVSGGKTNIEQCAVTVESPVFYDGSPKEPAVTVIDMSKESDSTGGVKGHMLEQGTDYTAEYADNTEIGTGSVTLKGIGRYTGETVAEFEIIQNTQTVALPESGSSEMYVGETLLITMDLQAGETASFVSDDENVADVNGYGLVTANRAGTAVITVTTGGNGSSAVRTLTVQVSLAPPGISDLTAGDEGVELTWDSVTGAETYEVYRRSDEDSDFETIGKVADTGEKSGTYTDTEAESGQTYTYYVVACCDNGDITSSPGTSVSITYLPAPRLMDVRAASSTSFIASWSGGDESDEEDENDKYEYELQYSTDPDFESDVETIETGGSATISRAVKDLEENTSYFVRVRTCVEVDGEISYSGWSGTKTVTTLDASQDAAEGKVRTDDWLTVFAGDSITYGLTPDSINAIEDIDIEGEKDVVAAESLNVVTFQTKDAFDGMTGVEKTISLKPDRVYSMIGLNDVAWRDHEQLIDYYTDIVQDLQEGCPGVDIVILSIPPVSREAEERQPGFADIPDVNGELEAMAADLGVRYYDYTDAFKDSDGYILEEYGSGEFHWSVEGYALFGELISAYDGSLD